MTEQYTGDEGPVPAEMEAGGESVGAQLREAREARGLSVEQVAAETRIPIRHIDMIERDAFQELPARIYAVGFSRTYARMLELDPDAVVARVRAQLDAQPPVEQPRPATFEPGDPARVPSRGLFWFAILGGAGVIALIFFFMRTMFVPAAQLPSLVEQQAVEDAALAAQQAAAGTPSAPAADAPSGPVVFTSLEEGIWVKFYDGAGRQLMQKQMALGESYTVPEDAAGPQLWTGRPDALSITIGGRDVPPLAAEQRIMRDVAIDAETLLARGDDGAASAPAPASPTG